MPLEWGVEASHSDGLIIEPRRNVPMQAVQINAVSPIGPAA